MLVNLGSNIDVIKKRWGRDCLLLMRVALKPSHHFQNVLELPEYKVWS